jgi:ATP-binding cassette subfamily B protein
MLRLIKRFMKGNWPWALAGPLFMMLEVVMDLMQPTLMSDIIDTGVAQGDVAFIFATGGRMLLYAAIGLVGGLGCVAASSVAAVGFASRLRQKVFAHIQSFSFVELDKFQTSSLITRLTNDVTQLQQIVMMGLRMMVRAPMICVGSIVMAYRLSPSLSLVLVAAVPVLLGGAYVLIKKATPLFMTMQIKLDRINAVMRENLLGVKVIKAFVSQDHEKKRFGAANRDLMEWSAKAMENMVVLFPLVNLVMNLSVVAVLWLGGSMAIAGALEIGKIMAFINYLIQIMFATLMLVMMSMGLTRAQAAARRLHEVLDTEASIRDGRPGDGADPAAGEALVTGEGQTANRAAGEATAAGEAPATGQAPEGCDIVFQDVSFRHHNSGQWILKHINLNIKEGQTVGIIGPTGSGKSTLVSLIPRLYDVTQGRILVGGRDVREYSLTGLRGKVGMVLQESILFAGTLEENLRFGRENANQAEIEAAAEDAQALDFILEKEQGFGGRVEHRGRNFSGGQKQRLSIARVLVRQPRILILDDAASAVDTITEAKIREAILRRMGSCTLIIIAQRIAAIKDADFIIVLNEGEIEAQGSHKELLKVSEVYRRVAAAQLGEEVLPHVG